MIKHEDKNLNLFTLLPPGIFRPLTGKNHRAMWDLLELLYEQLFGPDARDSHEEGFVQNEVTKEIENFLLLHGNWEEDDDESPPGTPLNIRANAILDRLVETGWLRMERVGVKHFLTMHPTIARFFERLYQFVHEGPQHIGGKVQVIYNQLRQTLQDPEKEAQGFRSTALDARRMINGLSITAVRVRDILAELGQKGETHEFVQRFFLNLVTELYIRDYQEIHTDNHPLRHRSDIVEMAIQLRDTPALREALLRGYIKMARPDEDPERMMEDDILRYLKFYDIDRYLQRLDDNVNEATRRSIAFLTYRLKTSDNLDSMVEKTIAALLESDEQGLPIEGTLLPAVPLLHEERLRAPVVRAKPQPRTIIKKVPPTPRELAIMALRSAMVKHRLISPQAIGDYLERQMQERAEISAEELTVTTVEDATALLALLSITSQARPEVSTSTTPALLRGLTIELIPVPGAMINNALIEGPLFRVRKRV